MNTRNIVVVLSLAACGLAAACSAEAPESAPPPSNQDPPVSSVDASEIVPFRSFELRTETFDSVAALDNQRLSRVLLAGEGLVPEGRRADMELWQSEDYRLQKNAARGELYFRFKEEKFAPASPAVLEADALRDESLRLLRGIGLPESEIGNVHHTQLMKATTERAAHEVHAHTTIVDRSFYGIRARGSRAAVVFDVDGSLKHLMVHWRPAAPLGTPGVQWRTRMTPEAIKDRAVARLAELGLSSRPAKLRYQYVPVDEQRADGTTVFAIKATAFVGVDRTNDQLQRPVEIDIDLDP
jgi:hypothetical protein